MRKITSILLVLSFVLVSVTGIQMVAGKGGSDRGGQYRTEQSVLPSVNAGNSSAIERRPASLYPKHVHEWGGYLFIAAGLVHLGLNWKPMKSYFTKR